MASGAIVAIDATGSAADQTARTELQSRGHTVVIIDDAAFVDADGDTYDFLILSESASSTSLGTKAKAKPAMIMVWEQAALINYGLTTAHSAVSHTTLYFYATDFSHTFPTDGTGTVMFTASASVRLNIDSALGAGAVKIATQGSLAVDRNVIVAYPPGSTMADATTASGWRIMFGVLDTGVAVANSNFWDWVNVAINETTGGSAEAMTYQAVSTTGTLVGTADPVVALSDADAATYIELNNGEYIDGTLKPIEPPSGDFVVTPAAAHFNATTSSITVTLRDGATTVATATVTGSITGSSSNLTATFASADISTVTQAKWNAGTLVVRTAATTS